jgi:hypothetical protein
MFGTIVTFRFGESPAGDRVRGVAAKAREKFDGMPGLRSKAFTFDPDQNVAVNFYVWESREAAESFFTPQLKEMVATLYGVPAEVRFVEVAQLVDNAQRVAAIAG